MSSAQRNKLLREIYELVQEKLDWDERAVHERDHAKKHTGYIRQLSHARTSLAMAKKNLISVETRWPDAAQLIEEYTERDTVQFRFEEVVGRLEDAIESAANLQRAFAGMIHPKKRNKKEKRLAQEELPRGIKAGEIQEPFRFSPSEASSYTEHWLIGKAAECLDKQNVGDGALNLYARIILGVFNHALGSHLRTEDSIRIELRRQRTSGIPELHPYFETTTVST